ncbi:MAG TPA: FkbM family methyltransferase [Burkholderiales bacterium]|nr:FkbM family methyltransferase [Burkholderiales bacterium]
MSEHRPDTSPVPYRLNAAARLQASAVKQALYDVCFDIRCKLEPCISMGEVNLPLDARVSRPLRKAISQGIYEQNEMDIVSKTLEVKDRVLECGAGIGLLSAYCALRVGSDKVTTIEANPFMAPLIFHTFALNHVRPELVIGAIGRAHGRIDFHVRRNFWASSSHPDRADGAVQTLSVPVIPLDEEVRRWKPTYLFIDIEGAEESLVGCSELPGVTKIMAEVHPELIGDTGVEAFLKWLRGLGFVRDNALSKEREFFLRRNLS